MEETGIALRFEKGEREGRSLGCRGWGARKLLVGDEIRVRGMFMMELRIVDHSRKQGSQTPADYVYSQMNKIIIIQSHRIIHFFQFLSIRSVCVSDILKLITLQNFLALHSKLFTKISRTTPLSIFISPIVSFNRYKFFQRIKKF
jgi:hypothetical protein